MEEVEVEAEVAVAVAVGEGGALPMHQALLQLAPPVVNLPWDLLALQEDLLMVRWGLQVPFCTISQFLVSDQSFA